MAIYRVWSGASGSNDGSSKANAFTSLASAYPAASVSGDLILIHKTHIEALASTATYVLLNNIAVMVVDMDASDAPATMDGTTGYISNTGSLWFDGGYVCFMRGLVLKSSALGGSAVISLARSDNSQFMLEDCTIQSTATGSSGYIAFGYDSGTRNSYIKLKNCTLKNANSAFPARIYCQFEMEGGVVDFVASTSMISVVNNGVDRVRFDGVDFSSAAYTLLGDMTSIAKIVQFDNCKLHASTTRMAAQTVQNLSGGQVIMNNCASSDVHYAMEHYCALGSTVVSASIYANDGLTYDGTNKCSWKIDSTANATFYNPYRSPWLMKVNTTLSSMTPYVEVVRDGSATAYKDNELWAEWGYPGGATSPISVFTSDRMTILGTAANQASSSKTGADWTGEGGTAWFGKLDTGAAITPTKPGHIKVRACLGVPSSTVYMDTQIRGAA